ncbi:hypothetical protein ACGFX4_25500, partial [Kitasatospora sp. NPDC048365]|uniref:hypothetical protein n=1 Tax=Kitasatospora sp. NPDC048365 TaxID=3364050 RepID=UPI003711CD16
MSTLDMTPGAQIPRTDVGNQTAVTQALSSAAYRTGEYKELEGLAGVKWKPGRSELFRPSAGEAFSRALIDRTLSAKRLPLVPSFGTDARMVVEHCLAAQDLRDARDRQLSLITLVFGIAFLPGALIWLAAYQAKAWLGRNQSAARDGFYGTLALLLACGLALLFALRPPVSGPWSLYVRVMMLAPVAGWFLAKRIVVRSVLAQRARWGDLVGGSPVAATVPKAVPRDHLDKQAVDLKAALDRVGAEQETNIHHYAGSKGILGVGARWGDWGLREDLRPADGQEDFRVFHTADLTRRITERLGRLTSSEVPNGGMPKATITQWVVQDIPEGADEIGRPGGADMDNFRMRDFAVQEVANRQTFGSDPRHRIAIQYVLHKGQLVTTMLVEVVVLHNNLQVHVTGHALGPLVPWFGAKPKPKEKDIPKTFRRWENQTVQLPLVDDDEVVRQAVRAPFHRMPTLLTFLGGSIGLPEPFCMRQAWTDATWASRFKSDDAIYASTPVVNTIHASVLEFLAEHDISIERFTNRSNILKSEMQGSRPYRVDKYDAGGVGGAGGGGGGAGGGGGGSARSCPRRSEAMPSSPTAAAWSAAACARGSQA